MKQELLAILPEPVKKLLEYEANQGTKWIDLIVQETAAYGFHPEEAAPCILAAYYVHESMEYSAEIAEDWKLRYVFFAGCRSALKLLSYGKYSAQRTPKGWMEYKKG